MNTLRWDRVDTVGSTVLHWIVQSKCVSMHANNMHGTWTFPRNADNIHRTWIIPQNADTQNTVDSSSFGSKFIALRIATEMIERLWYKLRMLGIPIDGPADVFLIINQSLLMQVSLIVSLTRKELYLLSQVSRSSYSWYDISLMNIRRV